MENAASLVAERLRTHVEALVWIFKDEEVHATVSIGAAGATLSMSAYNVLVKRADDALYTAKRGGRNRVARAPRQIIEHYKTAAE